MAILNILTYPHQALTTPAKPVATVDEDVQRLVDDMAETMYAAPGIGLAANQIGELQRIAVIDIGYVDDAPELLVFINPHIVGREGDIFWEEGCLSFPGVQEEIKRSARITVEALDRAGRQFSQEADGLLAVAIQHELDHLDGVTMIDRVSFLKRRMIQRQMRKKD